MGLFDFFKKKKQPKEPISMEDYIGERKKEGGTDEEIKEATTVGISDDYLGEKISSFIVLKRGCDLDASYVKDYCRNFLSRDKIPDMVTFVDSLPKGPSGKILRKELRK